MSLLLEFAKRKREKVRAMDQLEALVALRKELNEGMKNIEEGSEVRDGLLHYPNPVFSLLLCVEWSLHHSLGELSDR